MKEVILTEQEKLLELERKRKKEIQHYLKIGVTAFLTFCSCILFFFFMYRNEQFSEAFDSSRANYYWLGDCLSFDTSTEVFTNAY